MAHDCTQDCVPREVFALYQELHTKQHEAAAESMKLGLAVINERLEAMNEFRAQLDRQTGTFVTKDEVALRRENDSSTVRYIIFTLLGLGLTAFGMYLAFGR